MPTKDSTGQNVWFGVAMFLIGLIAGSVLTFASGAIPMNSRVAAGGTNGGGQAAPQAPAQAPADALTRMVAYAKDLGIDEGEFKACATSNKYDEKINTQMSSGQAAGISGTPGNIIYDMKSKKGIIVSGAQPIGNFSKIIDAMLKDPSSAFALEGIEMANNVPQVDFDEDHIRGDKGAKIAIIEYSDYQCPFCHSVHPTYQKLLQQYDGKIMWVYRHYPLSFHPEAMPLAVGAECAGELGGPDAYWAFSDKIMAE